MLASFHGDVWAGSIRLAASTAFSYQPVCPGFLFVVGAVALWCRRRPVQDADEPVAQGAQGLVVQVARRWRAEIGALLDDTTKHPASSRSTTTHIQISGLLGGCLARARKPTAAIAATTKITPRNTNPKM